MGIISKILAMLGIGKAVHKHKAISLIYVNRTLDEVTFIPYSSGDPSNVQLPGKSAKIVMFPGFEYKDFAFTPNNMQHAFTDATSIHISVSASEQYYYDVKEHQLYYRRIGSGGLVSVEVEDESKLKDKVVSLMTRSFPEI